MNSEINFLFLYKNITLSPLIVMGHNIGFYGEMWKIIPTKAIPVNRAQDKQGY